jgi:hypothetical protein
MRHRFTLTLYSDLELEAEMSDHLLTLPKSRRSEVIRRVFLDGWLNYKKNHRIYSYNNQSKKSKEGVKPVPKKHITQGELQESHKRELQESHQRKLQESHKRELQESQYIENEVVIPETNSQGANQHSEPLDSFVAPKDVPPADSVDDELDTLSDMNKLFEGM